MLVESECLVRGYCEATSSFAGNLELTFLAFLRQVEFFRSILFLTTNKDKNRFDAAVLGRNVRFYYECADVQRKVHMSVEPKEACSIAKAMGEKVHRGGIPCHSEADQACSTLGQLERYESWSGNPGRGYAFAPRAALGG
jgi:hypothetical protein